QGPSGNLSSALIMETMEKRPESGFTSYGRFFPNQDTMPLGGFGTLIALSLQRKAREIGNSVFVDKHLQGVDGGAPAYGALSRGLIDICLNGDDLDPFDICALCPVVTEAGGVITDWEGKPLSLTSSGAIAASASPALHSTVLDMLARRD
ncbi:inositol monophosphatase family protein, partial [Mesorhizobium sp. M1A.F.Ca.IN.020.32.1.1]|uniref:inositol monophosphatase family protein n=3 Tax=unclassified Mesorhizobium TaxID=325217 RepID=UPI0024790265